MLSDIKYRLYVNSVFKLRACASAKRETELEPSPSTKPPRKYKDAGSDKSNLLFGRPIESFSFFCLHPAFAC